MNIFSDVQDKVTTTILKLDSFENKEDMICVKLDVTETEVC